MKPSPNRNSTNKLGFAIYPKVSETQMGNRKVGSGFCREKPQSHKRLRQTVENQESSSACLHLSMLLPGTTDPMPAASRSTQRTHGGCGPPARWLGAVQVSTTSLSWWTPPLKQLRLCEQGCSCPNLERGGLTLEAQQGSVVPTAVHTEEQSWSTQMGFGISGETNLEDTAQVCPHGLQLLICVLSKEHAEVIRRK